MMSEMMRYLLANQNDSKMFFLSWKIFSFINLESSFEKANFNFSSEIRIAWINNFLRKYCLFKSIRSHCLEEDENV